MNDKDNEFSELVGEALGRASVAWSELPSGIFDSDACSVLHIDIMNAYNNEIKKLQAEIERLQNYVIAGYEEGIKELQAENAQLRDEISELNKKLSSVWKEAEEFYLDD